MVARAVAKGIGALVKKYKPRIPGMQWSNRRDPLTGKRIKVPITMMKKIVGEGGKIR